MYLTCSIMCLLQQVTTAIIQRDLEKINHSSRVPLIVAQVEFEVNPAQRQNEASMTTRLQSPVTRASAAVGRDPLQ